MTVEVHESEENVEPQTAQEVDLNRATAEELEAIPGIGPTLAQRVIEYRREKGAFLSVEEVVAVPGIGPALYARIADRLIATPPEAEPAEEAVSIAEEEVAEVLEEAPVEEVEMEAGPVAEEAAATPLVQPQPAPAPAVRGPSWAWTVLMGAALGIICTLLILSAINGSLALRSAPVITSLQDWTAALGEDLGALHGEVTDLRQRLEMLEGLPERMDAVEEEVTGLHEAVEGLHAAVGDLNQQVEALDSRVEAAEEDLATMQAHAEQVTTFFERLQSLLFDVFGGLMPALPSETSSSGN